MGAEIEGLADCRRQGLTCGIISICSAHPVVLRAGLRFARTSGATMLIEPTCNQVNHRGGYTGMTPARFAEFVMTIAAEESCPPERIVLGGDHLGPYPWRDRTAATAMAEAEAMVAAYVAAGFRKIHLDTSVGCRDEPARLDDDVTAARAARLAAVAEATARDRRTGMPLYVIGTEVPTPGGTDRLPPAITPTSPEAARRTIAIHRAAFDRAGLGDAFARAIAVVVQPGVGFSDHAVAAYDRRPAGGLVGLLDREPQFVFEAHSTDYQGRDALGAMVADGFAILKVGPELTFVLREALYGLDLIATDLVPDYGDRPLFRTMERLMQAQPDHWDRRYPGTASEKRLRRHFSLSDRIRYYWPMPEAKAAVDRLLGMLTGQRVPAPLLHQYLPFAAAFADRRLNPTEVLIRSVERSLDRYHAACSRGDGRPAVSPDN